MMEFPTDMWDNETYPLMPQEDRWIYNKLTVAERMGYECGPSGTDMTTVGDYCIRPIMNSYGFGFPGFLKFAFDGTNQPEYYPGYCWVEWFDGDKEWINFTDGAVTEAWRYGDSDVSGFRKPTLNNPSITALPTIFQDISKHMLIESIGGQIIEVAPRHTLSKHSDGLIEIREEKTEDQIQWPGSMWAQYLDGQRHK